MSSWKSAWNMETMPIFSRGKETWWIKNSINATMECNEDQPERNRSWQLRPLKCCIQEKFECFRTRTNRHATNSLDSSKAARSHLAAAALPYDVKNLIDADGRYFHTAFLQAKEAHFWRGRRLWLCLDFPSSLHRQGTNWHTDTGRQKMPIEQSKHGRYTVMAIDWTVRKGRVLADQGTYRYCRMVDEQ